MALQKMSYALQIEDTGISAVTKTEGLKGYTAADGTIVTGNYNKQANTLTIEDGTVLTFDSSGNCTTEGYQDVKLSNITAKTTASAATKATLATEKTIVDDFAQSILASLISKQENPELSSEATMLNLCNIAYKWANIMASVKENNTET